MNNFIKKIEGHAEKNWAGCVISITAGNEVCLTVGKETLRDVITHLKEKMDFTMLMDITAVDTLNDLEHQTTSHKDKRFAVVYQLLNMVGNQRVRVKVWLAEEEMVASIVDLFPAANWYEREVFDMYGVFFDDHPDLRRILTDYGFAGHPQRKDFPLTGFVEVYYDADKERVQYKEVDLPQDLRLFDFETPWVGTNRMGARHGVKADKRIAWQGNIPQMVHTNLPDILPGDEKAKLPKK
ncbi:MAG: NADH-quinone oxidoreductase subunit C [Hydrotalea sp.]|nr:NADH-quinone oxidoreductase subunit C [Hydrotalea sp.]